LISVAAPQAARAADAQQAKQTKANVMVELAFTAGKDYEDPFNDVTLDVTFIDPTGRELRVPAFWAGTNVWKVRYASPVVGTHTFRTEFKDASDKGLHGVAGKVEVVAYKGDNPNFIHGPLRVNAASKRYLERADGTPFFWLGDTWWMGLSHRLHWPEDVKKLAEDRKKKGFTVIQIVAGLYPDMHPFDPRGANEAGYPWEKEYARINPAYFDKADERLMYLVDEGFTPCIVGAWGYFMEWMGPEKMKQHWRYLIARYGAMPVVWCAAGEANLDWYLTKGFPHDDRKQVTQWTEVMRYMHDTDPFHRPITIHPTGIGRLSARHATDDVGLLDFDMLQTPHGERDAVPATVASMRESYNDSPVMPVIDGEASYERLMDRIGTEWTRRMFWLCMTNGAAGHTYGANGIWQVNRKGDPHGPSPHHPPKSTGYGVIPWDEAMNLGGSTQVGLGKKLFEQFEWFKFKPHREWAVFDTKAALGLEDAKWIWFPEGEPAKNAPAAKRYFRQDFEIPEGKKIKSAQLRASADDQFSAKLNGTDVGRLVGAESWKSGKQFDDVAKLIKPGKNVLTIVAENMPAPTANPAGLIAKLEVQFTDGPPLTITTDASWRASQVDDLEDSAKGKPATIVAKYGEGPWGRIDPVKNDDVFGPQSTGIPGVVRITYVPEHQPITVQHLGKAAEYTAKLFDPVTGATGEPFDARADDSGNWKCPPPAGQDHDWVLILEAKKAEQPKAAADAKQQHQLMLASDDLVWRFDWSGPDARLVSTSFENRRSGHRFGLSQVQELGLNFSAAVDRVEQPLARVADFQVRGMRLENPTHAIFELHSPTLNVDVAAHFQIDGPTRRKWVEVANRTAKDLLLLDVELDDFTSDGTATGGGEGQPVFVEGEVFAAVEHPAGVNTASGNRVQLAHFPGRKLAPGETFKSRVALVSVAPAGQALPAFVSYIQAKSHRPKHAVSVYTPLGINNLWGAAPTLTDEENLDVLNLLEKWQKQGVKFDYYTLDTGWIDPGSDLTRFRPNCFPDGPKKLVDRVNQLGMKFGLWFGTSWGAQSAWDYPPAFANGKPPGLPWREGYPITREGITFCVGEKRYHDLLKNAVLHHVRDNKARFVKFDGGDYVCDNPNHGHLTGKYSVEPRMDALIDIADAARKEAPDLFVMWYWGLRSPFWALYGDTLFESGLMMEGSATSAVPTLYYRDSVSIAQDQNAQHAKTVPPFIKDSLGVWIAQDKWGNYMGKQRWRDALVMDLARGNLLLPNLWGDLYLFDDDDVAFLARISKLAKRNESLMLNRRTILGDPWRNDVYGYAYGDGSHALLFANNVYFGSRKATLTLDASIGLAAKPGTRLSVRSHFPDETRLFRPDGGDYRIGDTLDVWLRPFESLMLEVTPQSEADSATAGLPTRSITTDKALDLGTKLPLKPTPLHERMDIRFADAGKFEGQGLKKKVVAAETTLPTFDLEDGRPILAVVVRLRQGDKEWRYQPNPVVEIAQVVARLGDGTADENVQMIPVPDSRQNGNTQGIEGSSWVVYKVRLGKEWSGKPLKLAVHAYLPDGVEAKTEAWVVKRWWREDARPMANGYFTDEPS
jgi:hypothetical protein